MRQRRLFCALAITSFFFVTSAHAIQILYDLDTLGGNQYQYNYTVVNDGSTGGAVELFDILFDPVLYDESSLAITTQNPLAAAWDETFLASGLLVPAAFDAYALSGGVPNGGSASLFSVSFTWFGADLPASQQFEIYDPNSFEL